MYNFINNDGLVFVGEIPWNLWNLGKSLEISEIAWNQWNQVSPTDFKIRTHFWGVGDPSVQTQRQSTNVTSCLASWSKIENYFGENGYESSLINDFALANSNKIHSYIRNITKSRSIPSTLHFDSLTASSDSDKAGLFNQYFHSVFINLSSSLSIDDLPDLSHTINSV